MFEVSTYAQPFFCCLIYLLIISFDKIIEMCIFAEEYKLSCNHQFDFICDRLPTPVILPISFGRD